METAFTLSGIAACTGGDLFMGRKENAIIKEIIIDSRLLVNPARTLFVALVTNRNDGHRYIPELIDKGVKCFLVSTLPEYANEYRDAGFLCVDNTLDALQKIGACNRKHYNFPVIGITGSNGKTIVKEWLFQLTGRDKKVVRSPRSFNSQIGVPLSLWKMNETDELGIFEAGISMPGEMEKLEAIIRPTFGIFTNIGHAHNEGFENFSEKTDEKLKLFTHAKSIIYCRDHSTVHDRVISNHSLSRILRFTWGKSPDSTLRITGKSLSGNIGTTIRAVYHDKKLNVTIPFRDEASVENAMHCWAAMLYMGYEQNLISERMKTLSPIAMRLELKDAINHCSLVNDSYNSDINSLSIALDFLNQQTQHKKKTVILSDILQSGWDPEDLYSEISGILQRKGISRLIGIGNEISSQSAQFPMEKVFYNGTDDFLNFFPVFSLRDEAVLLKGARPFGFERISRVLQQKSHETILEIHLDAMVHNLNYYRSKLSPGTKTMAMVKAYSYGSGGLEIAGILQFHRVDYLAVAYADEGIELRKGGISTPIMVMNPEQESIDLLFQYNLEPEIYNFRVLGMIEDAIRQNGDDSQVSLPVHLKIDTGMHRLGFDPAEVDELIRRIKKTPEIHIQSVFSHLAASEDPLEDQFTLRQIDILKSTTDTIQKKLKYNFLRHILNSAGISRFPEARMEMVRLGIGLYGVGYDENEQSHLRNVGTLKTIISQIKRVNAGETVGYNRKGIAERDLVIAVLPIGYADGFSRKLGNGRGNVIIKGHQVPTIGNISMDTCMADITDLYGSTGIPAIHEGDEVIIFGDNYPVSRLARDIETIPYEVLTSISRRVKRVYFTE